MATRGGFGLRGFMLRWLAAFLVVALSYNPTGTSYFHWARESFDITNPVLVLCGLVLVIAYIVLLRATISSIGPIGAVLVAAVVAAFVWMLVHYGIIDLQNPTMTQWLAIIGVSFVLGVGLSWSLIRRRLSGQYDIADENNLE